MASTAALCCGQTGNAFAGLRIATASSVQPFYPSLTGENTDPQLRTIEIFWYTVQTTLTNRYLFSFRRFNSGNTLVRIRFSSNTTMTFDLRDNAGQIRTQPVSVGTIDTGVWYHTVLMSVDGTGWVLWNGRVGKTIEGATSTRDSFPIQYSSGGVAFSSAANNRMDGLRIANNQGMAAAIGGDVNSTGGFVAASQLGGGVAEFRVWTISATSTPVSYPLNGPNSVDDLRDQFIDGTTYPELMHCFRINEAAGTAVEDYDDVGIKNARFLTEVGQGGFSSHPFAASVLTGTSTASGDYKVVTTPTARARTGAYKVLKTAPDVLKGGAYKVLLRDTPTVDGDYKVFATIPAIGRTGDYRVFTTAPDFNVTGDYRVLSDATTTKDGDYSVLASVEDTRDGDYQVITMPEAIRIGAYDVTIPATADTKSVVGGYRVVGDTVEMNRTGSYAAAVSATSTKDGDYKISQIVFPLGRSGDYEVAVPTTATKSGDYEVVGVTALTRTGGYKVPTTPAAVPKTGDYMVLTASPTLVNSGGYGVVNTPAAMTRTGGYVVAGETGTVTIGRTGRYQVFNPENTASLALRKLAALRQRTR